MQYFSMCSGIGGFELAIKKATENKWQCVGYSEINKTAIQCYEKNFKHKNFGDATRIVPQNLPDFGFLCAGFPCQTFSISGKRAGFEDVRGTIFFEIARVLSVKRPKLFLLENVKGLLSHDNGRTLGTILTTISGLGYWWEYQILNSKDFCVPQNRERIFIVGHLRDESTGQVFPIQTPNKKVVQNYQCHPGPAIYFDDSIEKAVTRRGRVMEYAGALMATPRGGVAYLENGKIKYRRFTPVEVERLNGFPDGWTEGISDAQRYKCLGNSVTVNVVEKIILDLLKFV